MLSVTNKMVSGRVKFVFNWARLARLQVLETFGQVKFTPTLIHLSCLKGLQRVALSNLGDSDVVTTKQIGLLAHKLGSTRPDCAFVLQ